MVFVSNASYAQVYEKVYSLANSDVQNRIDENKIAGIDMLTGVKAHHVVGLLGINQSNKAVLFAKLSDDSNIIDYQLEEDGLSIVINSKAVFTKEKLEEILQLLNASISGYNVEYSL